MLKNNMVIKKLSFIERILNDVGMKYVCRVLQTHSTITTVELIYFPWVSDSMGSELEHLLTYFNQKQSQTVIIKEKLCENASTSQRCLCICKC